MLFYVFTAIWERRFNGGSRQFFISLIGTGCDDHCNVNDTTPHTLCISYTMHDTYERRKDFLFLFVFFLMIFSSASLDEFNSILLTPVQSDFFSVVFLHRTLCVFNWWRNVKENERNEIKKTTQIKSIDTQRCKKKYNTQKSFFQSFVRRAMYKWCTVFRSARLCVWCAFDSPVKI